MADFEDSTSPTWSNLMTGQQNLKTPNKTISLEDTVVKKYSLKDKTAYCSCAQEVCLSEKNMLINGQPFRSLVDFGLYAFHNHLELTKMARHLTLFA
jgi:malate synthase